MPQVGCDATLYIPVETVEEGKKVMDILACYDLFQLENDIKPDFSNVSGLEVFNVGEQEWEDWYFEAEDGEWFEDIDDYFENNKDMQEFTDSLFSQLKGK